VHHESKTHERIATCNKMARLRNAPKNVLLRDLPEKDKLREAIQFLKDNPDESPATTARACGVKNKDTVRKTWQRERKRIEMGRPQWGGGRTRSYALINTLR